jgi:hypothetical protein
VFTEIRESVGNVWKAFTAGKVSNDILFPL